MTVIIVTDSLSDLTSELIGDLDITLVPLTVLFGHETYLDRITISTDESITGLCTAMSGRPRLSLHRKILPILMINSPKKPTKSSL